MAKAVAKTAPLEAEANDALSPFEFEGVELSVPTGDAIPRDALKAFENGHLNAFVEGMLGDQFSKVAAKVPTLGDLKRLGRAISEAMDSNLGE